MCYALVKHGENYLDFASYWASLWLVTPTAVAYQCEPPRKANSWHDITNEQIKMEFSVESGSLFSSHNWLMSLFLVSAVCWGRLLPDSPTPRPSSCGEDCPEDLANLKTKTSFPLRFSLKSSAFSTRTTILRTYLISHTRKWKYLHIVNLYALGKNICEDTWGKEVKLGFQWEHKKKHRWHPWIFLHLLWTFNILKNSCKLNTSLAFFPNTFKISFNAPVWQEKQKLFSFPYDSDVQILQRLTSHLRLAHQKQLFHPHKTPRRLWRSVPPSTYGVLGTERCQGQTLVAPH